MSSFQLGNWDEDEKAARVDVDKLIEGRLLLQAGSGFGKSTMMRRIIEQCAGKVQQFVIDPEGEFASLREKFDFVIAAARDGDALAHPRTAGLLLRRLMETGVSAVLDTSELKKHERRAFVRLFLEELMQLPRAEWAPVLVAVDEAHEYAPEADKAESLASMVDLATRGRKRGFTLLAATQRIGKFSKDCAAELHNKLIGYTSLDIDVKRAAFELGKTPTEALAALRELQPGEFFSFGPALSPAPRIVRGGSVETAPPKRGARRAAVLPKPTAAIMAVLPKLADLPKEAEEEARTAADLRRENATLKRDLTLARKAQPRAPEAVAKPAAPDPAALERARLRGYAEGRKEALRLHREMRTRVHKAVQDALAVEPDVASTAPDEPARRAHVAPVPARAAVPPRPRAPAPLSDLPPARQKILNQLAWLRSMDLYPTPKETLAAVCGVSPTSGGYFNNLGALRSAGLIEYPQPGMVGFTDAGAAAARAPQSDGREVHEHWLDIVSGPQRAILAALIERHGEDTSKDDLAGIINVSPTSGGYFNNLGRLRTLGAIDYPSPGKVALTRYVMP